MFAYPQLSIYGSINTYLNLNEYPTTSDNAYLTIANYTSTTLSVSVGGQTQTILSSTVVNLTLNNQSGILNITNAGNYNIYMGYVEVILYNSTEKPPPTIAVNPPLIVNNNLNVTVPPNNVNDILIPLPIGFQGYINLTFENYTNISPNIGFFALLASGGGKVLYFNGLYNMTFARQSTALLIDLRYINTKLVDIGALPIPYIPYLIINNMTNENTINVIFNDFNYMQTILQNTYTFSNAIPTNVSPLNSYVTPGSDNAIGYVTDIAFLSSNAETTSFNIQSFLGNLQILNGTFNQPYHLDTPLLFDTQGVNINIGYGINTLSLTYILLYTYYGISI